MDTKPVFHGSDIEKICEYYHLNKNEIVRFGANVNPPAHVDLLSSYPDREYTSLRETISEYCSIPAEFILPGNGSSELIALLIDARAPKRTLILGPTYSEYSRELALSGSTQEYYHLKEAQDFRLDVDDLCRTLETGFDFLIICNPNNPTSSAILHDDMEQLLTFCSEHDIFVMIDETYVEFAPDISTVTAVPFTKRFIYEALYQPDGAAGRVQILRGAGHAVRIRHHRQYELPEKNERKTDPLVTEQHRRVRRRKNVPGSGLHPPDKRTHPLRTRPDVPCSIGNAGIQSIRTLCQFHPPEDSERGRYICRYIRPVHPEGAYDPGLCFVPVSGGRIHQVLHHDAGR